MRGKLKDVIIEPVEIGITPAGAGKTSIVAFSFTEYQDHPRRCGENNDELSINAGLMGSPPQVRGKH